jgi:hypothetical protein
MAHCFNRMKIGGPPKDWSDTIDNPSEYDHFADSLTLLRREAGLPTETSPSQKIGPLGQQQSQALE